MTNAIALPLQEREAPDMLRALVEGLIDGFNRCVDIGHIDKAATSVMLGYLSAASIGLRSNGLDQEAQAFLDAAKGIEYDWTAFERTVRALAERFGNH